MLEPQLGRIDAELLGELVEVHPRAAKRGLGRAMTPFWEPQGGFVS